eukprot:scaffold694_cov338-Pavlova_lutheri.AAC.13
MPCIVKSVKTYHIAVQQRSQDLVPHWENTKDFARGEGAVQEETTPHVMEPLPQKGRQHHQVIIVDPDVIPESRRVCVGSLVHGLSLLLYVVEHRCPFLTGAEAPGVHPLCTYLSGS